MKTRREKTMATCFYIDMQCPFTLPPLLVHMDQVMGVIALWWVEEKKTNKKNLGLLEFVANFVTFCILLNSNVLTTIRIF